MIGPSDICDVERLLGETFQRAQALMAEQRHNECARCAGAALSLIRAVDETAPIHGVLPGLFSHWESRFQSLL